ncbi:hypothetical protein AVEN_123108-1 [Araneus ventricosus]|uniref:Uncharacterized protein n=1 Tax=Araneus ventricosus TaxID=182803 RepID=A0A4Y2V423_ARAVE|nr:hypothetical protein AVEN_123108-1 [Araneus ventricosus]
MLSKPYRASPRQNVILRKEIQKMLAMKIIKVGYSDYTSPMVLVEAPGKEPRPCIDYRNLNKIIETKFYPLQNLDSSCPAANSLQEERKFEPTLFFDRWSCPGVTLGLGIKSLFLSRETENVMARLA